MASTFLEKTISRIGDGRADALLLLLSARWDSSEHLSLEAKDVLDAAILYLGDEPVFCRLQALAPKYSTVDVETFA